MNFFGDFRYRRLTKGSLDFQVAALRKRYRDAHDVVARSFEQNIPVSPEAGKAYRDLEAELKKMQHMRSFWVAQQKGIIVPENLLYPAEPHTSERLMTLDGEAWLLAELRKSQRSDIEFWAKIVLPIGSLVLSIIALLKKH